MFEPYLTRWHLTPDGEPMSTPSSLLLPVRGVGEPASLMLKVSLGEEERRGGALMVWWRGDGAARVLAHQGEALLLERAIGGRSLAVMAREGRDDEASRVLCAVAAQLHAPKAEPPPATLVPLARWFQALAPAAARHGGILRQSLSAAEGLLARPRDVVVLHGDLHHGNVLDFADRGWLAIDPKGLSGERGFDFANIFCNPDLETATAPGRLARQATVVAAAASLDRARLLRWILAYAGLSAAWSLQDGDDPALALTVARIAAAEIEQSGAS
jgi:streptomycin 6-kinase